MEMMGVATFALVAGLVDDLRSRKVHNALVFALLFLSLVFSFLFRGMDGTALGAGTLMLALIATIPLFAAGIWGGGDVKLFAVFAFAVDPTNMFWTLIYSFVWGGLFGLTRAALHRQLLTLVRNTYRVATRQRVQPQMIHKMPFTFALLLGWFTQLTLLRIGGLL